MRSGMTEARPEIRDNRRRINETEVRGDNEAREGADFRARSITGPINMARDDATRPRIDE